MHRDRLMRDEVQQVAGVLVTTRRRAVYDLARTCPDLVDAVAALAALSRKGMFAPDEVLRPAERYPRARGRRRLPEVVGLADRRAGSPMGDPPAARARAARAADARGPVEIAAKIERALRA